MSNSVSVTITQQGDYHFLVDFGAGIPPLQVDEPAPLGAGEGPSPNQRLLAAVTNRLSASLLFALKKFKQDAGGITTTGTARIDRDKDNRLRVQEIAVTIGLGKGGGEIEYLDRILAQFEVFCTVTQSVRHGIPVAITVEDGQGVQVKSLPLSGRRTVQAMCELLAMHGGKFAAFGRRRTRGRLCNAGAPRRDAVTGPCAVELNRYQCATPLQTKNDACRADGRESLR
jgi:uncharacterized OsmC-like protein